MAVETKRICNGTFGELWLDGDYVGECYKAQAKVEFTKEEIKQCGMFFTDSKVVGCKGTGSLTMHKVNSRMAIKVADMVRNKQDVRFTLISKLVQSVYLYLECSLMILLCLTGRHRNLLKRKLRLSLQGMNIWIRLLLNNR